MKKKVNILFGITVMLSALSCNKVELENQESIKNPDSKLITLESGVVVEKNGKDYIFEGDIILSDSQLKALNETGDFFPKNPPKPVSIQEQLDEAIKFKNMGVYPTPYNLWAMVRYTLNPNLATQTRQIITEAIQHWEATTNVRFYNATGQPTVDPVYGFAYPYVEFTQTNDINNSFVGRVGGKQVLNLAKNQPTRIAIHEIGHAIGLYHEMSRPDRDNYVTINISNVPPAKRNNFDKKTTNYSYTGAFDFNSIMMYGAFDFAINENIRVITRDSDPNDTNFGNSNELSFNDRMWANGLYIPYIARSDVYAELAPVVYKADNTVMTASERLNLQAQLNNGNPTPPDCCRLPNIH